MAVILVVDDEQSMRDFLTIFLRKEGHETLTAANGVEAMEHLRNREEIDLIISDVRMSQMDGMQLLEEVKRKHPPVEVIVMTAYSSTTDAIVAMKAGAYDYITKPFKLEEIKGTIQKALENRKRRRDGGGTKDAPGEAPRASNMIGVSKPMREIFRLIHQIANSKATILITGESGTGKELVARAIHSDSKRADRPFVSINCGAIPAELMESELFGHVKGSFTGAVRDKEGLFETASGGTLFLDEIAELPMKLQVKLLRALQERRVLPVGGTQEVEVDVRVISATNRSLKEEVAENRFREDLFYRLNVIPIRIPPLRDRKEDIPLLIEHFLGKFGKEHGRNVMHVSEAAMMILQGYDYPGNVRELINIIERSVALEETGQIRPQSLPVSLLDPYTGEQATDRARFAEPALNWERGIRLDAILEEKERDLIARALEHTEGVKTEAAKKLGITFRSLRYRLKKLGMDDEKGQEEAE